MRHNSDMFRTASNKNEVQIKDSKAVCDPQMLFARPSMQSRTISLTITEEQKKHEKKTIPSDQNTRTPINQKNAS